MAQNVTMDDVAARAGVSRATVSFALRRSPKISAKRTGEILRLAQEMGYFPNVNASRLASATASTYGVLLADLHNPIMADILDGFAPAEAEAELEMHLASGFNDATRERASLDSFLSHRVAGIVLAGSRLDADQIQALATEVPTVVVGRNISGVDCVLVDDALGGKLAAEHLLKLGHCSLAHLDGGAGAGAKRRKDAFLRRCRSVKGANMRVVGGDYSQASGYAGAQILFSDGERPTALFAANDLMALGVLGAAKEHGLSAGVDFSLCGFDDIAISAYGYISLTSISYSRAEMGRTARALLDARVTDPSRPSSVVELQAHLVARGSSCPPCRIVETRGGR
jgi:DNA-binding LacI/PurR family transcriptional regulator